MHTDLGFKKLESAIFSLNQEDGENFERLSLELFKAHAEHNVVYREFLQHLHIEVNDVNNVDQIPFLPIRFFKHRKVTIMDVLPEVTFESSTTTGSTPSEHHVHDLFIYQQSILSGFEQVYGNPSKYCILALLPSYLERGNSSLVHMAKVLIAESRHPKSSFVLDRMKSLSKQLKKNSETGQSTILLGVTFALLELAEKHPQALKNCIIMETGGMKGRRREMPREEVHAILKATFEVESIHSEYGMTELMSQAYSNANGIFQTPPWMRVSTRDLTDPLSQSKKQVGGINVIDLANLYSCPFIATEDIGECLDAPRFKVLGRYDNSEIRGCNLMLSQ